MNVQHKFTSPGADQVKNWQNVVVVVVVVVVEEKLNVTSGNCS
jgi:hypothetical protein